MTLLYGAIIAIPTAIVAGPLYCILTRDINPEIPKNLYNPKIFKDDEMPSFGISVFTALVPVILMAAAAISKLTMSADLPLRHILTFFGQPDIALTISVAIAIYTFGIGRGKSMEEIMKTVQDAVLAIAMILLIVGGGGALKQVLIDSALALISAIWLPAPTSRRSSWPGWLLPSSARPVVRRPWQPLQLAALPHRLLLLPVLIRTDGSATGAGSSSSARRMTLVSGCLKNFSD